MTHYNSRFSRLFLLLFLFSPFISKSQTGSTSPYSRYGIGDIYGQGFTHQAGMGGLGASLSSPFNINMVNPASYIADSIVIFEVGALGDIRQLESKTQSTSLNSASFSHLALGFPIKKGKVGVTFGVVPLSSVDYDIVVTTPNVPDIGTIRYEYIGDGGFNKFFVGTGVKILKNLNAGLNISYLFGTIDNVKSVEFPSGTHYFNSRYIDAVTANGFHFDYGLLYEKPIKNGKVIRAGLSGAVSTKVNALNTQYYYNYTSTKFGETIKDSVFNETENRGDIKLPQFWRSGISLEKTGKWMIGADFNYYNWNAYESFGVRDTLKNSYNVIVGGQKYTNRFDFRMGVRYGTTYLNIKETQLNEYGFTVGLGIKKLLAKRPPSAINIGFEIGQRGTLDNNLIREQYYRFFLGFTLTDIWFVQPKFD